MAGLSITIILISTIALCLNTLPALEPKDQAGNPTGEENEALEIVEAVCIAWFTLEFILRFFAASNKWSFLKGGLNIIEGLKYNTSITYLDLRWVRPAQPIIRAQSLGIISRLTGVEKIVDIAVQNVLQKNNGFAAADKSNHWGKVITKGFTGDHQSIKMK